MTTYATLKAESLQRQRMWDAGMLELYGLTPWTRGTTCLYRLAGKRHDHHPFFGVEDSCLPGDDLWDHFTMWHDSHGQLVITTEPYISVEDVADVIGGICDQFGLVCDIGDESPYYPGHTTLFMFRRAVAA